MSERWLTLLHQAFVALRNAVGLRPDDDWSTGGPGLEAFWQAVSHPELVAAALIVVLLLAHVALLLGVAAARVVATLRDRRRARQAALWHRLVPAYLYGEAALADVAATVRRRDRFAFAQFAHPYLVDIAGQEKQRLGELLQAVGVVALMRGLLQGRGQWPRAFAAQMLGLLDFREARPALRRLLRHRSELLRFAAAEALVQMQDTTAVPEMLSWLSGFARGRMDRILALVYGFGPEICPVLHDLLRDPARDGRERIVVLAGLEHYVYLPATWDILQVAVSASRREVRLAALRALAALEEATLTDFFVERLRDEDAVARAIAARALCSLGREAHAPALAALLGDADFWVLRETVAALLAIGPAGEAVLEQAERTGTLAPTAGLLLHEQRSAEALPEGR